MANHEVDKIEDIDEAINPITPPINEKEGLEMLGHNRNQPVNLSRFSRSFFKIYSHLIALYSSIKTLTTGKENKFSKNSGWNLDKTDNTENSTNKLFTALGALNLKNWLVINYTTLMNNIRDSLDAKINTKENAFSKKSGWNLDKTDSISSTSSILLATAKAVKTAYDKGVEAYNKATSNLSKLENLGDKVVENFGAGDDPSGIFTIQQSGAKIAGYRYFDTANKVAFKCIKNNSLTYADAECYEAVDNVSLNNKLQNLYEVGEGYRKYNDGTLEVFGILLFDTMVKTLQVTFPVPFINSNIFAIATHKRANEGTLSVIAIDSGYISTTECVFRRVIIGTTAGATADYLIKGRWK